MCRNALSNIRLGNQMSHLRKLLPMVVLMGLGLISCTGGRESAPIDGGASSPEAGSGGRVTFDPCTLVPRAELVAAVGYELENGLAGGASTLPTCTFFPKDYSHKSFTIGFTTQGYESLRDAALKTKSPPNDISGLGSRAFYTVSGVSKENIFQVQVVVQKGGAVFEVDTGTGDSSADLLEIARAVAARIAARL